MAYRYHRVVLASNAHQILSMIVRKALDERNVDALVVAYREEIEEEFEETHEAEDGPPAPWETEAEHKKWQTKTFGILHKPNDVEKVMSDTYVATYRRLVGHPVSREQALEVFMFPLPGFPEEGVPKAVAVAVAEALARRDAAEANQMREWAKERYQQH